MNRIATSNDQALSSYITPGDFIVDTPTSVLPDGMQEVNYYFMEKWPTIREGATIWVDGKKLDKIKNLVFRNSSDFQKPWPIQSATIKPVPGTSVKYEKFSCHGLKHLLFDGENDTMPGLLQWPSSRKFATGYFGFHAVNRIDGSMAHEISCLDGGTISMRGFEAQHGFAGVRTSSNKKKLIIESFEISNFYIHDTFDGEGMYLGDTWDPALGPVALIKNLRIGNGIITRSGCEALQMQHVIGGADISNVTTYQSDTRYLSPFNQYQDTGLQFMAGSGYNRIHHVLVDGYASMAIGMFGSNSGYPVAPGSIAELDKVFFNDGRKSGIYQHNSLKIGLTVKYKEIYFRGFNKSYYDNTGEKEIPYIVSSKNGTDRTIFEKVIHDGSIPKVFQSESGIEIGEVVLKELPAPQYILSGFYEPANKVKVWSQFIAKHFPASYGGVNVPNKWYAGDILIDANPATKSWTFHKVMEDHFADAVRPYDHPKMKLLTWDESGIRNDQKEWNATTVQSLFPPDDLRQVPNSPLRNMGIGYIGVIEKEEVIERYVEFGEEIIVTKNGKYRSSLIKV